MNTRNIFKDEQQICTNWCWAAVGSMVYRYFHSSAPKKQCQIVGQLLPPVPGKNSCDEPGAFNETNVLEDVLSKLNFLQEARRVVPFSVIQEQIGTYGLPICARIQWRESENGHAVIIIGYGEVDGEQLVDIADPFYGYLSVDYTSLKDNYLDRGAWTDSYLIRKPN